jgi:hypothetical protein
MFPGCLCAGVCVGGGGWVGGGLGGWVWGGVGGWVGGWVWMCGWNSMRRYLLRVTDAEMVRAVGVGNAGDAHTLVA